MLIREILNADGMTLTIACGGLSNVGLGITGTWAGTVSFQGSADGINFFTLDMTPFASGTAVGSATANGNYFTPVQNLVAVRVKFARTSGSVAITLAASNDGAWQNAFLAPGTIYNSSYAASGANTLTQAAQANRAWGLTSLEVSMAGPTAGGAVRVVVYDGTAAGTVLYEAFLVAGAGSVGSVQLINLPVDAAGKAGIYGTIGNAMTISLLGLGSQSSIINTQFTAG